MDSVFLIDKPEGFTSHDIVDFIRKKFNIKKVGHAGTLDPVATGLLIILTGKCTKLFYKFANMKKQYLITLKLGTSTDTMDREGKIIEEIQNFKIDKKKIVKELDKFKGEILQVPPMYSAIKFKGKKLYELARKGETVERKARKVYIYKLDLVDFHCPFVKLRVICSKGTYTRKICCDLGNNINIPAHQYGLVRESIGDLNLQDAVSLNRLKNLKKDDFKKIAVDYKNL